MENARLARSGSREMRRYEGECSCYRLEKWRREWDSITAISRKFR